MALVKILKHIGNTGSTVAVNLSHIAADGAVTRLDHADGIYRASPATPNIPLVESGTTGIFIRSEDRSAWADGAYAQVPIIDSVAYPDGAVEFQMKDDAEVMLDASAESILSAVLGSLPQTAHVFTAGERIVVARGDKVDLAFALGPAHDCTGKKLYFCAKQKATDTTPVINVECSLTDELNVVGTVPLTPTLLATVLSGVYEYERRDGDGTSNPHTIVQGPFQIAQDVRQ